MNGFNISDIERFCELMYNVPRDQLYLVPYSYPITFADFAPTEQRTGVINLSANGDFILTDISYTALVEGETDETIFTKAVPDVRALISDASSGSPFTQNAVILETYAANGLGPAQLPFPRLLSGRGAINVQISNLNNAAATYEFLQIALHGVLVRAWSQAPQTQQA